MSNVLGGIKAGDAFLMVSMLTNNSTPIPAVLNAAANGNGFIYYWETDMAIALSSTLLPVFSATTSVSNDGKQTNFLLKDTINGGGMGYRSDGITLGNALQPSPITIANPTFALWSDPFVFLANVPYSITNAGRSALIFLGNTPTYPTFPANNIIILPTTIYGNCPQCATISDPHVAVANWWCLQDPQGPLCGSVTTLNPSWTSLSDASDKLDYKYCTTGNLCGTGACRGPCTATYDDCNPSGSTFACVINPERYITTVKWYESPYFIAAMIFILVMIILVIIVAIVVVRHIGQSASEAILASSTASTHHH